MSTSVVEENFSKIKILSFLIYDAYIKVVKLDYNLVSYYIIQVKSDNDKNLIEDLSWLRENLLLGLKKVSNMRNDLNQITSMDKISLFYEYLQDLLVTNLLNDFIAIIKDLKSQLIDIGSNGVSKFEKILKVHDLIKIINRDFLKIDQKNNEKEPRQLQENGFKIRLEIVSSRLDKLENSIDGFNVNE
ncbi:hypothetical protein PACTADRAFT_2651 [Pachysolen tannophilus NRRL Y-2460]|uniref:Uncharacterized protein n=1 Tax=Pachysolen tannophilus NRRL Y-2460 TaxID=669874 RepID=A0A1E4TX82_PACTA|nr:hypothetical protein PACTADRAFT_2651 [Pachysolen tannophilus NRRL Y-2460]